MKKKPKQELPPLCAAVRRVRDAHRLSQEAFARLIGVAVMTVSHFETGRSEPRTFSILMALESAAEQVNLDREAALFKNAALQAMGKASPVRQSELFYPSPYRSPSPYHSLQESRLMVALRLTFKHFREDVPAVEKALAQALRILDEVTQSAANRNDIDPLSFLLRDREASDYIQRMQRESEPRKDEGK